MRILTSLVLLMTLSTGYASNDASRVEGVSEFLIDRANQSFLYIFEAKAKQNKLLSCYFPKTHSMIKQGDLNLLLTSKEMWHETLEEDIEMLLIRATAKQIIDSVDINKMMISSISEYVEMMQYLMIEHQGKSYPADFIELSYSKELRAKINLFYNDFVTFNANLKVIDKKLATLAGTLNTQESNVEDNVFCELDKSIDGKSLSDEFELLIAELKTAQDNLSIAIKNFDKNKSLLSLNKSKIKKTCTADSQNRICKINNSITNYIPVLKEQLDNKIGKALILAVVLPKYVDKIESKDTTTGKVVEAFSVISDDKLSEKPKLQKLRRTMLFFAQLADITDPSEVKQILSSYLLPASSFLVKRENNQSHFMVTAYLGYSSTINPNDEVELSGNTNGLYAPIGLEYSQGYEDWNYNIMLAPVDFGYPITLKANGVEEDIELDELIAPSVSISFGYGNYPINYGISYQKGRKDSVSLNTEDRTMLFISFDMPLFAFY